MNQMTFHFDTGEEETYVHEAVETVYNVDAVVADGDDLPANLQLTVPDSLSDQKSQRIMAEAVYHANKIALSKVITDHVTYILANIEVNLNPLTMSALFNFVSPAIPGPPLPLIPVGTSFTVGNTSPNNANGSIS